MNSSTEASVPFGLLGTIVGIHDYNFEVLFDKAFIGGTNLNGRCSYLKGAIVEFTDVYNLDKW